MLNNVILMGRLTAAPEARTTSSDVSVTSFTLAVEHNFADKQSGEKKTDFIDCIAWRQTADFICRYFAKGQLIAVEGSLQTRTYQDKDGNNRKVFEVIVDHAYFAEKRNDGTPRAETRAEEPQASDAGEFTPIYDGDLAF